MLYTIPVSAAEYSYNDNNQITSVTFPSGKVLTYTYDNRGNLISIVSNGVESLRVVSTDPVDQSLNVSVEKTITVTFNKEIQAGSNIGLIAIRQGETPINYTNAIAGSTLSIIPTQPFANNTYYQVAIPIGAVQDSVGTTLETELIFGFTTDTEAAIPVTGVSLNKTSTSISVGGTENLTAVVVPENATNQNVAWTSSNEAIVTVGNDGTVTGISAGTAVITATTVDGSFTASCEVTVNPANVPVDSIVNIEAQINIKPKVINVNKVKQNKLVSAKIKFPDGYNEGDIDRSSVTLKVNNVIIPCQGFNNGEFEFNTQSVICALGNLVGDVPVNLSGSLIDGTLFIGTDSITIN